jgi:hypothetical protein
VATQTPFNSLLLYLQYLNLRCAIISHIIQSWSCRCNLSLYTGQQQLQSDLLPSTLIVNLFIAFLVKLVLPLGDAPFDNSPTPTEACKYFVCKTIFSELHRYKPQRIKTWHHNTSILSLHLDCSVVFDTNCNTKLYPKLLTVIKKTGNYIHHSSIHIMITVHCYIITIKDPLI